MDLQERLIAINENGGAEQQAEIKEFVNEFVKSGEYWAISPWTENSEEARPFVGLLDNETPCYFVFTKSTNATNFGKHYDLSNEAGECLLLKLKADRFPDQLKELKSNGVEAVLFDEGAPSLMINISTILELLEAQ
ncbi:hypothetical protein LRR81_07245 [Metabacillus sp. GX 13764]|uniref:hypothetical protein n=1 Tax=Metabacillus kandeliae TaxID=2900151 RepID=UPI001E530A23|nr:hypothetical protein [Metabacillus kandeliae]MCD7034029.1 hypothetical protein [Metabacillus kandeliae]